MTEPLDPRHPQNTDRIERLIDGVLKQQPPRRAPSSLEARVMAEIERRAALPWYRMSFLHWPLLVQAAFVLASLALVRFALTGTVLLAGRVQSDPVVETITRPLGWAGSTADAFSRAARFCSTLFNAIPSHWLYIGTALAITLYIAAVALSATAYRTLYANK
jgi:hypothetical protein